MRDMDIQFSDIVSLLQVLLWPAILLSLLFIFRKPIGRFVEQAVPRISRLSLLNVFDVELREVAELNTQGSGVGSATIQELVQRPYFESSMPSMLSQLEDPSASDCALIDLGKGDEWLTSRLFLLSFLLKQLRNLRCFVFVQSGDAKEKRYIGNATPEQVQDAIIRRFPKYADELDSILLNFTGISLYKTRAGVQNLPNVTLPNVSASLSTIMYQFVNTISGQNPSGPDWVQLSGNINYENAAWVDEYQIRKMLGKELNESYVIKDIQTTEKELVKKVMTGKGEFVAIVDVNHNYQALVDRFGMLEQISKMLGYSQ